MAAEFNWPALPPSIPTPELIRTLNLRLPALNRIGRGVVTGGASVGAAGLDLYTGLAGTTLQFRKLKAGANVSLNVLAGGELEVASTPPAGGTMYFANVFRSAGDVTGLDAIAQYLADTGHLAAGMQASTAVAVNRLFAKALSSDANTVDTVAGLAGTTYGVTLLSALTAGQVDLAKAGVTGKVAANILRAGGGAALSAILANVTDTGNAAAAMQESGGRALNRLLAKALAGDADSADGLPDGTTYQRTLASALTAGAVDLAKAGVTGKIAANILRAGGGAALSAILASLTDTGNAAASMQESGGRALNRLYAKALLGDPDSADAVIAGTSYVVTTLNQATGGGRGFAALDTSNILTTGVDPAATLAGRIAQVVAKGATGVVFMEDFEQLPSNWNNRNSRTGTMSLVAGGGVTGGKALRATGNIWRAFPYNIPYDPSKLYRMRARAKQVTDPTTGGKNFYFGVEGIAADGVTLINAATGANSPSQQHYVCASLATLTAGAAYTEFTGWFRGTGTTNVGGSPSIDPANPRQLYTGVTYFRPVMIANESGGDGVADIDYLAIDEFDEEGVTRTYTLLDTGSKMKTGALESGGKALNLLLAKALAANPDTLESVPDGTSYGRALLTALTSGQVDLAKAGVVGKVAANILRAGGGAALSAILANLADTGNATAAFTESGGKAINLLLAKALAANPDTLESVPDGTTYGRALLTALTSGQVDLAKAGVVGKVAANILRAGGGAALSAIVASLTDAGDAAAGMKISDGVTAVNRLLAKALTGDANTLDGLPEGTTYQRALASALTSGQVDLAKAGVIGRVMANIARSGTNATTLATVLQYLADAGNLAAGMTVSDATTAVNRLFAKAALADPNTIDTVAGLAGTTYGATLLTALTSGAVDLTKSGVIGNLAANRITASSLSAITAALGVVTSGMLQNAAASPVSQIRLDAAAPAIASSATNYLNLPATASALVLRFGPSTTDARLTYAADGTMTMTGVVRPSQLSQSASGSGDFAGSNLFTAGVIVAESTGTRTAGKRLDFTGGRLRLLADAVSRFELGDYTANAGSTSTPKTDTAWSVTTSGNIVNAVPATWTSSSGGTAGPTNPIAVNTDLPDASNQYAFDFTLSILVQWALGQTMADAGQTRARLYSSKDAGATWKDQGILATVTHSGTRNGTTSLAFAGVTATVPLADIDTTVASNTQFKIVPEVYCPWGDDGAGGAATPTATGTATVVGGTDKVAWSKLTGGTTFPRRYPLFRTIAGQPLGLMEPNTFANLPADNAGADGEFAYSSTDHAPYFWDGIRKGVLQPEVFKRLTAANAATTSTTGADVANLTLAVQAGEVWEIEWIGECLLSVTTATVGFNVASTGTFTARSGYQGQCPAGAPNTGAGIMRAFQNAAGTATGTAGGMGNPGSATLGVPFRVTAYLKIATSGTISLQLASSSGTVTVQEGSRMSAWRVA